MQLKEESGVDLEPVHELLRVFRVWPDGVIPLGTDVVSCELDVLELSF